MDKKRVNILLTVLEAVAQEFPETEEFIQKAINNKCFKASMSEEEVIFLQILKQRVSLEKLLFCSEYVKGYCMMAAEYFYNP